MEYMPEKETTEKRKDQSMKKRILALLLAGLITASFASCISSSNRPETPTGTETEETIIFGVFEVYSGERSFVTKVISAPFF